MLYRTFPYAFKYYFVIESCIGLFGGLISLDKMMQQGAFLPSVCLVAIVKNEETNPAGGIVDYLDSILPFVPFAVIVDTGSTDGTLALLRQAAAERYPWLRVRQCAFSDFATARNRSLALARAAVREAGVAVGTALVLDADERLTPAGLMRLRSALLGSVTQGTAALQPLQTREEPAQQPQDSMQQEHVGVCVKFAITNVLSGGVPSSRQNAGLMNPRVFPLFAPIKESACCNESTRTGNTCSSENANDTNTTDNADDAERGQQQSCVDLGVGHDAYSGYRFENMVQEKRFERLMYQGDSISKAAYVDLASMPVESLQQTSKRESEASLNETEVLQAVSEYCNRHKFSPLIVKTLTHMITSPLYASAAPLHFDVKDCETCDTATVTFSSPHLSAPAHCAPGVRPWEVHFLHFVPNNKSRVAKSVAYKGADAAAAERAVVAAASDRANGGRIAAKRVQWAVLRQVQRVAKLLAAEVKPPAAVMPTAVVLKAAAGATRPEAGDHHKLQRGLGRGSLLAAFPVRLTDASSTPSTSTDTQSCSQPVEGSVLAWVDDIALLAILSESVHIDNSAENNANGNISIEYYDVNGGKHVSGYITTMITTGINGAINLIRQQQKQQGQLPLRQLASLGLISRIVVCQKSLDNMHQGGEQATCADCKNLYSSSKFLSPMSIVPEAVQWPAATYATESAVNALTSRGSAQS